ncbi:hypothetical protein ACSHT0_05400 [Tepidicaulis sp. LMO-SS28]|uniref:hypothetical protein n=1 Tax=Tepidicaulis sp. LMO-SS28 TaxID=3447455 RepID=UPI003EDF8D29
MGIVRIVIGYLAALVTVIVLGSAAHTIFALQALAPYADVEGKYLSSILFDIQGMGPMYGAIMGIGLLIAFIAAYFVQRLAPSLRWLVFTVAGAVAVVTALTLMETVFFDITPIAGARTALGMACQALAGAAAGVVYTLVIGLKR